MDEIAMHVSAEPDLLLCFSQRHIRIEVLLVEVRIMVKIVVMLSTTSDSTINFKLI